jgi:hypothetical protein
MPETDTATAGADFFNRCCSSSQPLPPPLVVLSPPASPLWPLLLPNEVWLLLLLEFDDGKDALFVISSYGGGASSYVGGK